MISAVPLALLNRIEFDPPLPGHKIQMIQRMPMGSIIKTITYYKKPYWRNMSKLYILPTAYSHLFVRPNRPVPCPANHLKTTVGI